MSRAVEQKASTDGFIKPGELVDIRAGAMLSLHDRRVFNLLIENAWAHIAEDRSHNIALSQLRGPRHRGGERVADSIKALMDVKVEVPTTLNGEPAIFTTRLLGDTTRTINEDSPHAMLVYEFPKGLRQIIQDSAYWGRVKAYVMFAFTSKYALALYEAICLRINMRTNEQTFTVEAFRSMLGVEDGKLKEPFNLKKWAIDLAVTEVNGLSDFVVSVEPVRSGGLKRGPLSGFRVSWERKDAETWRRTMDELLRPKVGRAARIRGKAEIVHLSH